MQVGEVEYLLKTGDSLYFNSIQKHGIMPVSNKVIYLDIFVEEKLAWEYKLRLCYKIYAYYKFNL